LIRPEVQELIHDDKLDLKEIKEIHTAELDQALSSDLVLKCIEEVGCSLEKLIQMLKLAESYNQDHDKVLEKMESALEKEYSLDEIIEKYRQDKKHLDWMSEDPTELLLENSNDENSIRFP
jgi:hypothetical protein